MKCRAEISFSGLVVMARGQEKDIPEGAVLDELLRCGYVSPVQLSEEPVELSEEPVGASEEAEKEAENGKTERNKSRRGKSGDKS